MIWPLPVQEDEEIEAMTLLLKNTSEWKKLQDLEGRNLKDQVREYIKMYGAILTKKIVSLF